GSDEEPTLQILDEQTFLVQAQTDLEEVNELLDMELPLAEEYQTLGGFLIYQLQKIPTEGETLLYDNYEMTVASADGPRLERIRIQRLETASDTASEVDLLEPVESIERIEPIESTTIPDPWDLPLEQPGSVTVDRHDPAEETDGSITNFSPDSSTHSAADSLNSSETNPKSP
ncbi:MAG TPA: transporter associated domain-containing protein, partial [Allocoleopsis sp.]